MHDTTAVHDTTIAWLTPNWKPVSSGTNATLYDVSENGGGIFVAVGAGGIVIRSYDNGVTWHIVPNASVGSSSFYGVAFFSVVGCYAVGDSGTIFEGNFMGEMLARMLAYKQFIWHDVAMTMSNSPMLDGSEKGFIVGSDTTGTQPQICARTTYSNGWFRVSGIPGSSALYGVDCIDSSTATAVGGKGLIMHAEHDALHWFIQPSGVSTDLFGVDFIDDDHGMAVGGDEKTDERTILKTTNGGATWERLSPTTGGPLYRVHCRGVNDAIAVGAHGAVLTTRDGGATWTEQTLPTQERLLGLTCRTTSLGVIVGDGGTVFVARN